MKNSKPHSYSKILIIIGLISTFLLIGAIYFVSLIFSEGHSHNNEHKNNNEIKNGSQQHLAKTHKININVNSIEFNQNYMQAPNPEGYKGFKIGTSKADIEKKFGKSEGVREINGYDAQQYGDLAVSYNQENKVDHVYVTPRQMTKKEFTDFYSQPNETKGDIWYYNANIYNGFVIKVFTSRQYIKAIENVPQI